MNFKSIIALVLLAGIAIADDENSVAPQSSSPQTVVKSDSAKEEDEGPGYSEITRALRHNYIGASYTESGGYGLSYRRWGKTGKNGFQINLLPWYRKKSHGDEGMWGSYDIDSGYEISSILSAGALYYRNISTFGMMRLNGFGGARYEYRQTDENYYKSSGYYSTPEADHHVKFTEDNLLHAGIGVELEILVWKFAFTPSTDFSVNYDLEDKSVIEVMPMMGMGFYFRF